MGTPAMQTHEFIKELTEAGLTERQAEAIARHQSEVIMENLASKQDFELLKHEFELLKHDIATFKQETKQDLELLKHDIATFKQETQQMFELFKKEMIIKFGVMLIAGWVAAIGIILGAISVMLK